MTTLFTADTHFGHGGALGLFRRPFPSVAVMDAALVARWNEAVGPEDEVWHLGDFAVRRPADAMTAVLERLNGRKRLVAGNADGPATRGLAGWESVADYAEAEVGGLRLVLGHNPFRRWNGMGRGVVDLHGHSHGRLKPMARQLDVGVDAWDFRPASLEAIRERLARGRRKSL